MKKRNQMRVANDYGIMVKKCCASCANKDYDEQDLRCCLLCGKHVKPGKVCEYWEMSNGLKNLGRERGKVQRRRYQLFLMDVRETEQVAKARGLVVGETPVECIRRDFEELFGSRYLIR